MSLITSPSISAVKRVVVAAERVVPLRDAIGVLQLAEIARAFAVVEDDLLVELDEIVKHRGAS